MVTSPSELFDLALKRHRQPWNWTLQFAGIMLLGLTLAAHSYLLLAASMILFGAGFYELHMPEPSENLWFRFVSGGIQWEKNWVATPWTFGKIFKCCVTLALLAVTVWALVVREIGTIGLLIGFLALARVVVENRDSGVEP
ncbi:hypothetical protein [Pseudodesulfovibrio sediminis]|uniref:Uncharacterized protein n=1 Tax=Pseudodesulfovibrio sediminis TaxID=2810563 RepID=A0ABN6ESY7_9BACT|nr:hypothetical protein [Pseudodesulfovibrio sediminis]BCS88597.1 hypothetical protein PSDVSF_18390 [Pseudodesulfovibrio sediminis]